MESKKSKKADLESKRPLFFQIGLVITLLIVFFAFDIRQYERPDFDLGTLELDLIEEEDIPITRPEEPPPPPPEASEELVVVEDDVEIEDEFIVDAEADLDYEIPDYEPVEVEEEEIEDDYIFEIVEDEPEFPGGQQALQQYLRDNIRYPTRARESGVEGTVFVTFVVEPDGSITNVEVLRGIGAGCDDEAVRVVQNMPNWEPGKQRGQPVRVQFNLPVRFVLN